MKCVPQMGLAIVLTISMCIVSAEATKLDDADSLVRLVSSSDEDIPSNALAKVVRMIDRLKVRINNETELQEKMYKKYKDWGTSAYASATQEMEYAQGQADTHYATLVKTSAAVTKAQQDIDRFVADLAETQAQLKKAEASRKKEKEDYKANLEELEKAIEAMSKAIGYLSAHQGKGAAALVQVDRTTLGNLLQTFSTVVDAVSLPVNDKQRLAALIQSNSQADDSSVQAPRSGEIFDMLEDMKEKAETQKSELEADEIKAAGSFQELKLSLKSEAAGEMKGLEKHKAAKQTALGEHASAEKDYNKAMAIVTHSKKVAADLKRDDADQTKDHKQYLANQGAELEVLDKAKEAINAAIQSAGGAQDMSASAASAIQEPSQLSLLEESSSQSEELDKVRKNTAAAAQATGRPHFNLIKAKVVGIVKDLAKSHHSASLAQLASRMKTLLRYGLEGDDPFAKVTGLIKDMIEKLNDQLSEDQGKKHFCDTELAKTKASLEELGIDIETLDRLMEVSYMKEVDIKNWVKATTKAIAEDAKEQAEKEAMYQEEKRNYLLAKDELTDSMQAVGEAIALLTKMYGEPPPAADSTSTGGAGAEGQHDETMNVAGASASFLQHKSSNKAKGSKQEMAGHGIIEMLKIIQDDLAKSLELEQQRLDDLNADYAKVMADFVKSKMINGKDVEYFNSEYVTQHRHTGEVKQDDDSKISEKESVATYYMKLKHDCVARPGRFTDRKAAREDEIEGLKAALAILKDETALIQKEAGGSRLRGLQRARRQFDELVARS